MNGTKGDDHGVWYGKSGYNGSCSQTAVSSTALLMPLTLWGLQGEKPSYATRGPVVDFPHGRPMVLGWPQGTEVAPQVRLSPPTTDAPWALLFGLEVNDAQGETTHLPPVGMNPLETMDLIWSLGDFLADVLKDLEFSVGSLTPDGRPGGHTFLIHGVTGSANFLFERLILFRAVLETIASARGFTAKTFRFKRMLAVFYPWMGSFWVWTFNVGSTRHVLVCHCRCISWLFRSCGWHIATTLVGIEHQFYGDGLPGAGERKFSPHSFSNWIGTQGSDCTTAGSRL